MKSPRTSAIAIALCLALNWGYGQRPTSEDSLNWVRPPLKAGTVALQLAAGTVGGAAGFLGVAAPIAFTFGRGGPEGNAGPYFGALAGVGFGIPFGATMGVSAIGRTDSTTGSIFAASIGSYVGLFLIGVPAVQLRLSPYYLPLASAAIATSMYNLTRRYRRPSNADGKKPSPGLNSQLDHNQSEGRHEPTDT
ncbi:MAG: hypothetical protein V3W14_04835 [Candidatus Neomarinimicrobiota bacterium]